MSPAPSPAPAISVKHSWRIAALAILCLAAYSNSFRSGFVLDNRALILDDARVHSVNGPNISRILTGDYWPDQIAAGLYRPVTTFTYLLNYAVFGNGDQPAGYHWINLLLHAINASLVYALALLIFESAGSAFILAALWADHPVLTESVTNIIGRADLLAGLGVLAGLLCYLKGQTAQKGRFVWALGLAAAQALGLFSKESAVVLIGLMLLCDLTWPLRSKLAARVPFYVGAVLICLVFLFINGGSRWHMNVAFTDNPLISAGFWSARLTAFKVVGRYLWLFVWPAHLSADYSFNTIPVFSWRLTNWADVVTVLVLLILAIGSRWLLRWRRTQPPLFFFASFFAITLLPTSNLIVLIGTVMAERFMYLPYIGLAGCLVIVLRALSTRFQPGGKPAPKLLWAVVSLLIVALAVRTYERNFDWQDDTSLWTSAVQVSPDSAKAHLNLGVAILDVPGRLTDAIGEYQIALGIEPNNAQTHYNLGLALSRLPGRLDNAIEQYRAAVRIRPDYSDAHNNLGNALSQVPGDLPEAIAEYRAALRLNPDYTGAHMNLGNALSSSPDHLPEAIGEYRAALRLDPGLAAAHYDLGSVFVAMPGHLEDAITEFRLAIKAQPDYLQARNGLGVALAQAPGRLPDAVAEFEAVIHDHPEDADSHVNLGLALSEIPGRQSDGMKEFEAAARINPRSVNAHYQLGKALARLPGRKADALRELESAYQLEPDPAIRQAIDQIRAH